MYDAQELVNLQLESHVLDHAVLPTEYMQENEFLYQEKVKRIAQRDRRKLDAISNGIAFNEDHEIYDSNGKLM